MTINWRSATGGLAIVTALAWVAQLLSSGLFDPVLLGGFIPARVTGDVLVVGALPWPVTPLTAALLHNDLLHLGLNLLILLWCGMQVEQALGPRYFLLLYIVGAFAAAAGQWAMSPSDTSVMIGASGAISAVIGFYAIVFSTQRVSAIGPIPAAAVRVLWLAAGWIGLQLLMSLGFGASGTLIAIGAHVGGFVAGLLLARPLLRLRFAKR